MDYHRHDHTKEDGRVLRLYSREPRDYVVTNDLPPLDEAPKPTKRWHPIRQEYVYYNAGRNTRTLNPPPEYNPLAAVQPDGFPGEIPVTDFEVAIFPNRWPSLAEGAEAEGRCEVVVYSPSDTGSLGDLSVDHIALVLQGVGERVKDLYAQPKINAVVPFENRGAFIGVTLPHPHGQIYAFENTPVILKRQAKAVEAFGDVISNISAENTIDQSEHFVTFCPEFSRYPYETWIIPKVPVFNAADMTDAALIAFATALKDQIIRLDSLFEGEMSYAMWHAYGPKDTPDWPYHIQFWPLQRGEGKMKYLASIEQIAQTFMVDVMPEDAAAQMRGLV